MHAKTKTILTVTIIFLISLVVIVYIVKNRADDNSINSANIGGLGNGTVESSQSKPIKTVLISGTVESVDLRDINFLKLKNGENNIIQLAMSSDVIIFAKKGTEAEKKQIEDIKKGSNVIIEINQENSLIISVELK